MYKVIEKFTDLQDNNYKYRVGDVFPHSGLKVSKERIAYLASKSTKRGRPVIAEVVEKKEKIDEIPFVVDETLVVEEPEAKEEIVVENPKPKRNKSNSKKEQ